MASYTAGSGGDYATLQTCFAAGVLASGDTVQILAGYNVDERCTITGVNNITVVGDVSDPGQAVITWSNPTNMNYTFTLSANGTGWAFKGITVNYTGNGSLWSGCYFPGWSSRDSTWEDCRFETTTGRTHMYYNSSSVWRRCKFDGSNATSSGGSALPSWQVAPTIESCLFVNFGGVAVSASGATVTNCTFYNGRADADCNNPKSLYDLANATVVNSLSWQNNTASGRHGFDTWAAGGSSPTLTNCISWGAGSDDFAYGTQTNCTGSAGVGSSLVLADAPNGDYYPAAGGLAQYAGTAATVPAGGDLARQPFQATPSIGCFEYVALASGDSTTGRGDLFSALRYGWGLAYSLKIEGVPFLFSEVAGATPPTGYAIAGDLVIDSGSKIGSVADRRTGFGRAYDLTVQLTHSNATAATFQRPSKYATITQTLGHALTAAVNVETSETTWTSPFYIGNERIEFSGTTTGADGTIASFTGLTRGTPASDWKAYTHPYISALASYATDRPSHHRGRRVELYASAVDPFGNVQGAHIHSNAALLWVGTIETAPRVNANGLWEFRARPLERRLTQPASVEAAGTARLGIDDDDQLLEVNPAARLAVRVAQGSGSHSDIEIAPFAAATGPIRFSAARAAIKAALDAHPVIVGSSYITAAHWRSEWTQSDAGKVTRYWRLVFEVTSAAAADVWRFVVYWLNDAPGPPFPPAHLYEQIDYFGYSALYTETTQAPTTGTGEITTAFAATSQALSVASVEIDLTEGDPSALPTSGWLRLESGDHSVILPYRSLIVGASRITAIIDQAHGLELGYSLAGEFLASGVKGTIDVSFMHSDAGRMQDCLRRAIMSSGRTGDNSADYDTQPAGAGLDIERVNVASFDTALDGLYNALGSLSLQVEAGTSVADLYGGLLALGQRAIVTTYDANNSPQLHAVRTSVAATANTAGTITDADLARVGKSQPVRPLPTFRAPNSIELKVSGAKSGHYYASDLPAIRAQGANRLALEAHGLAHNALTLPFLGWAREQFASARTAQAIEIDVVPWANFGSIGDAIALNVSHFAAYSADAAAPGYNGPARVLGVQFDLKRQLTTLTLLIDGAAGQGITLSPAAPVVAYDSATAPTYIRVPYSYLGLMQAYAAAFSPFELICYEPGNDAPSVRISVSAVTTDGSTYTELATSITAGSVTLSQAHRLTMPLTVNSNTAQRQHMHTDSAARWV